MFSICDLPWCRCICFVEIFPTILVVLSSEFRCAFRVSLFFLNFLFSHLSSQNTRKREEREKTNKERKNLGHIEISMMTSPVSLTFTVCDPHERSKSKRDLFNAVGHTRRPKVSRLACLWSARVSPFDHRLWFFLMSLYLSRRIFSTVPVVLSLEFQCVANIFIFPISPY